MTEKEQKASTDAQEAKASLAKALTEAAESEKNAQDEIQDAKKEVKEARKAEVRTCRPQNPRLSVIRGTRLMPLYRS